MNEMWRDIYYYDYIKGVWVDYRGLYQVSNKGRVKSLGNGNTNSKEIIMKPGKTKGYLRVLLSKDGKQKQYYIHRLVAFMFIENNDPEYKTQVNHINEFEKDNNCVNNLEWATPRYNTNYGTRNERASESMKGENHHMYGKHGSDNPNSKKVIGYSLMETKVIILQSTRQGKIFGFDNGAISKCCNGKLKSYKGFRWQYVKEEN